MLRCQQFGMFDEIVVGRVLPGFILETSIARRRRSGRFGKTRLPEPQELQPVLPLPICSEGYWRDALALAAFVPDAHGTGERIVELLGCLLAGTHQALEIFRHA